MTGVITSLPPLVEQPPGNSSSNPAGLPGVTYTAAIPTLPQTWTGLQTFNPGSIQFAGSTSGNTLLNATAIASGTLTLPAATDTLVARNTPDTLTNKSIDGASNLLTNIPISAFSHTGTGAVVLSNSPLITTPTGIVKGDVGLGNVANVDTTNAANISSGTLPAGRLPNPSASTLGGVQSLAAVGSKWINTISTSGVPSATQPAFTDISGQATLAQLPTLGANTVLGSIAGGTPVALSTAQHTSLVNTFTTSLSGAVPSPGAVASKFLRDDGTWQTAAGTGTVTIIATTYPISGGPITTTGTLTSAGPTFSGRLSFVSTTAIKFVPYNGDTLKINGVVFQIPSAGIAGVANTSVFVNGAGGSNLAASTVYYVYAFSNSGTVTADFSTTAHATSSTAGNVGTEIKSGDDTRTLIGMIRTNGSSQFVDAATQRFVRSWFNDPGIVGKTSQISALSLAAPATNTEISTSLRVEFLSWTGELVHTSAIGYGYNTVAGNSMILLPGFDGTVEASGSSRFDTFTASVSSSTALSSASEKNDLSEGYHYASGYFTSSGSSGTPNFVVATQVAAKR